MSTAIRAKHLTKRYALGTRVGPRRIAEAMTDLRHGRRPGAQSEPLVALDDVSFDVEVGEVVGIIGHNGAGKSTLLKIISRVTAPDAGSVEIRGRVGSLLEVGTGFHPELTGRENIYLNGAILGMRRSAISQHLEEILAFAGIDRFADTPVKRYSSGMYTRLAFAVAAHLEPEILVVDEVLSVGDAAFQAKSLGKMNDLAQGGRTVLFVSHNTASITRLCDRCLWIDHGMLRATGPTRSTINAYLSSLSPGSSDATFDPRDGAAAQFQSVALRGNNGPAGAYIEGDAQLGVVLVLDIHEPVADLHVSVAIRAADGTLVLHNDNANDAPGLLAGLQPGRHHLRLELPSRLLAPGTYTVDAGMASNFDGLIDRRVRALTFTLIDNVTTQDMEHRGVIGLDLPWTYEGSG